MKLMHCEYHQNAVCRSCSLLPMTYDQSLAIRFAALSRLFPESPIAKFQETSQVAGSRIRAKLAISGTFEDPQIGFWDDRRVLVQAEQCPLHDPAINAFVEPLKQLIRQAKLTPYNVETERGELKFAVVTWSPTHEQMMVQLVLRSREAVDRIQRFWSSEKSDHWAKVRVLSVNLQPVRSSQIAGPHDVSISEQQRIPIQFGSTELLFGSRSFLQTNYQMASLLYRRAADIMLTLGTASLLDLYCGVGAFSLTAGAAVQSITGIDVSANAIACAQEAAARNGRDHANYRCQSLNESNLHAFFPSDCDTIVCNPPRRGLDGPGLELIRTINPSHVIYSSCNPITLQRDTALLLESGFQIVQLTPFDMFPYTHHCEVLAVLSRESTRPGTSIQPRD